MVEVQRILLLSGYLVRTLCINGQAQNCDLHWPVGVLWMRDKMDWVTRPGEGQNPGFGGFGVYCWRTLLL